MKFISEDSGSNINYYHYLYIGFLLSVLCKIVLGGTVLVCWLGLVCWYFQIFFWRSSSQQMMHCVSSLFSTVVHEKQKISDIVFLIFELLFVLRSRWAMRVLKSCLFVKINTLIYFVWILSEHIYFEIQSVVRNRSVLECAFDRLNIKFNVFCQCS